MSRLYLYFSLCFSLCACNGNLLDEEVIEEVPELNLDELEQPHESLDEKKNLIVQFDSIQPFTGEQVKASTLVRSKPNGDLIFKIHSGGLEVHCSAENRGEWVFIEVETPNEPFEVRPIEKGTIYEEIWSGDKKLITIYYVKDEEGKNVRPFLWEDDSFMCGYTSRANIIAETVPERELEKIIKKGDRSKKAFDEFLWKFQFEVGGDTLKGFENIQMFYKNPVQVDGESAPDRLLLIFQDDTLVAIQHDRPVHVVASEKYNCEFDLTLSIIADWDKEKRDRFSNALSYSCIRGDF